MAGGVNSKKHINKGTDSTITQEVVEVQEPATVTDKDFYDGIPCFADVCFLQKSRIRQSIIPKVSEVNLLCLGRAGTLGGSMMNLNAGRGFISGATIKGNKISILAFEVANTIVKGFNLLQSLSTKSIRHLAEEVLLSDAVQDLVSKDMDELLRFAAADKRQELRVFSDEVIRFGNHSKDTRWHNLDRYFEKISRELNTQRLSRDEAESIMQQLMTSVQFTAELFQELEALENFDQAILKCEEEGQRVDNLAFLRAEVRSLRKQIRHLKKKSLWSRSLEEIMEKFVDIVNFLHLEIHNAFGCADGHQPVIRHMSNRERLGPAGLALHYAKIVLQVDSLIVVARSSSIPANTRDELYQSLPTNIKLALRSKLRSFHVVEELAVADINDEMDKTLDWMVPIATNTVKAHHSFGWVGEWAKTSSEMNRKVLQAGVMGIETLYHVDKYKIECYILELLVFLHYLVIKSKAGSDAGKVRSAMKSPVGTSLQKDK